MNIPLVDLNRQYLLHKEEIDLAIAAVIEKSAYIGNLNNPFVKSFESDFANFIGLKHCIACGNGTDALEILLKAMGVVSGDEVIVPAISWIATSEAVSNVGAKPVFVDVDPNIYCIDPDLIESKITKKTKVIIPVHLYGHPADMPSIMKIADRHGISVIEDCAQAHGAEINGKKAGTFGKAASFSFFPGKNLGAFGDAGGMLTNDEQIAEKSRMIAQHGQSGQKHIHLIEGRNSRMDGIQAAVLSVKLKYLEHWTDLRIAHAAKYRELLEGQNYILPVVKTGSKHVFHLYVIQTSKRREVIEFLKSEGIFATIQYPTALPFLDAYSGFGYKEADFPVASKLQHGVLSLPIFPEIKEREINFIADTLIQFSSK